jgi:hypothetical protein
MLAKEHANVLGRLAQAQQFEGQGGPEDKVERE